MSSTAISLRDVMQVCRNGHVITDLFYTFPERALGHCDRCGALTFTRCQTCGQELPGSLYVADALPIGESRPPQYCSACGAAFPWTPKRPAGRSEDCLGRLETLLRRLPATIRQLRTRHGNREPFNVQDDRDLGDLVRAILPLQFGDVRLESRTPSYAVSTITGFRLEPSGIALTVKKASTTRRNRALTQEVREDIASYSNRPDRPRTVVVFVYDPEFFITNPDQFEVELAGLSDGLGVSAIIASK
jgi:hypothetical protein